MFFFICFQSLRLHIMCIIMSHFTFQILVKYMFVDDWRLLVDIAIFIEGIYAKNSTKQNTTYYAICDKYGKLSELIVKSVALFFATFIFMIFFLTFCESVYTGHVVLPMRIYLPGIDADTIGGIAILLINNVVQTACCILIVVSYNSLIFLIFANIPMVSLIIIGHLNELNEILGKRNRNIADIKLLHIIFMHRKYKE